MKRILLTLLLILLPSLLYTEAETISPSITIRQGSHIQGEPIMVTLENITSLSEIKNVMFDNKQMNIFMYQSKPTIFIGTDLKEKVGEHPLTITLTNNQKLEESILVEKRELIVAPLGIPKKMGGNTKLSQKKLTTTLEKENLLLEKIMTNDKKLWTNDFIFPVVNPIVVDSYGYSRKTGEYSISHKGTDFKAKEKTPIYAMNRGVVRIARKSPIYGNMVVIDHGLSLMTFYMHLSKLDVKAGQVIEQGELIGLSGQTGYALGPHLHLTLRLNGVSVDPMKFMSFFDK